jgi:hypothetical protein
MDARAAILAGVPPVLAIVVEKYNPISKSSVRSEAERVIQIEKLENQDPDVIANTALGAVAVASVAPTILSVVSGVTAILAELSATGFVVFAAFTVIMAFLVLNLTKSLSSLNYYEIATTTRQLSWPIRLWNRVLKRKSYGPLHTKVVSRFIYATNSLLLFLCALVWVLTDDKSMLAGWLRAHSEAVASSVFH